MKNTILVTLLLLSFAYLGKTQPPPDLPVIPDGWQWSNKAYAHLDLFWDGWDVWYWDFIYDDGANFTSQIAQAGCLGLAMSNYMYHIVDLDWDDYWDQLGPGGIRPCYNLMYRDDCPSLNTEFEIYYNMYVYPHPTLGDIEIWTISDHLSLYYWFLEKLPDYVWPDADCNTSSLQGWHFDHNHPFAPAVWIDQGCYVSVFYEDYTTFTFWVYGRESTNGNPLDDLVLLGSHDPDCGPGIDEPVTLNNMLYAGDDVAWLLVWNPGTVTSPCSDCMGK